MKTKSTTRLKELLARPELLVMSGGFSPLHARMSEVLGYEAFFMSGSQVAPMFTAIPDVGLARLGRNGRGGAAHYEVTDIPGLRRRRHRLRQCRQCYLYGAGVYSRRRHRAAHRRPGSAEKIGHAGGPAPDFRRGGDRQVQSCGGGEKELDPDFVVVRALRFDRLQRRQL